MHLSSKIILPANRPFLISVLVFGDLGVPSAPVSNSYTNYTVHV